MVEHIDVKIKRFKVTSIRVTCDANFWWRARLSSDHPTFWGPKSRSPSEALRKALEMLAEKVWGLKVAQVKKAARKYAPKYVESVGRGTKVCHAAAHVDDNITSRAAMTVCGRRLLDVRAVDYSVFCRRACRKCQEKLS